MKKQFILMFALWAVALSVFAQNSIYVCKTDGTFEKFAISDVDSICFSDPKLGEDLGYQWVDLGLSVKWATYNVGGTDTLSYGDFYAWGEVEPKSAYNKANYAFANLDTIITTYDSLVLRLPQADTIITIEMDTTINDTDTIIVADTIYTVDEYDTILYKVCTDSLTEFDVICDTIYTDYDSVRVVVTKEIKAQLTDSISKIEGLDSLTIVEMVDAALLTKAELIDSLVAAEEPIQNIVNCRDTLPYSVVLSTCNIIEYKDTLEVVDTIQFVKTSEVVVENKPLKYNQYDRVSSLEDADDVVKAKWGGKWRMPTSNELKELVDSCKWEWVVDSIGVKDVTVKVGDKDSTYQAVVNVYSYKVTGPSGYYIYLPAAGYQYDSLPASSAERENYVPTEEEAQGFYLSKELGNVDYSTDVAAIRFDKGGVKRTYINRAYGRSVRAVMPRK